MAEYTGKNLVMSWIWSGGTVSLAADHRTVGFQPTVDFADATAGADNSRKRIATIKDTTITFSGLAQTGGTALEDALVEGIEGTVILGPEGTAAGKRKYTLPAFSAGAQYNYPYADVVEINVTFNGTGDLVRGVY